MDAVKNTQAVIFLGDNDVVKEMLYPEFEAILDRVVGIDAFKGQRVPALYVHINGCLQVTAVVCFFIDFDRQGVADPSWNIPLLQLVNEGIEGPDLGAGPIQLSCRSHCSVSWFQRQLWDPATEGRETTFTKLMALVARNRLRLEKRVSSEIKPPSLASVGRSHINALKSQSKAYIEKLQRRYHAELSKQREALVDTEGDLVQQRNLNQQYEQALDRQTQSLHNARKRFQYRLAAARDLAQRQHCALRDELELKMQAQVDKNVAELTAMLEMREAELFYRDKQINRLQAELTQLQQERRRLLNESAGQVLQGLEEEGVEFVVSQPGLDSFPIPLDDIDAFLSSPVAYKAKRCSVDQAVYLKWMAHYASPVCNRLLSNGSVCGETVFQVDRPSRFVEGESDRCAKHSSASERLNGLINLRGSK